MREYNKGMYLKHSPIQIKYLNEYIGVISDDEISINSGLTLSQVTYYRMAIIGANNGIKEPIESWTVESVQDELDALLKFHANYSGCMIESLEYRIKILSVKAGI